MRAIRFATAIASVVGVCATAQAADADDAALLCVFLRNGTSITSYGEYARVGDRIVFSMPLGSGGAAGPQLQLISLPERLVDWPNTERYAESVRYARYVATRGDLDYAALNNEVARAFSQIGAAKEPARRLELALAARRTLVEWPAAHYGYRANDIAQISGILDEVISELRAETGGTAFDLSFVATVGPPALSPLSPPPTERELVEQALAVARLTDLPVERMSLLEAIAAAIEGPAPRADPGGGAPWRTALHAVVVGELNAEREIDATYDLVTAEIERSAARHARRADVAAVERLLDSVTRRDRWLGRRRPDRIRALVDAVRFQLETAQALRLARDRWELRLPLLRKYQRVAADLLGSFDSARPKLEDIRRLAGLSDPLLARLTRTMDNAAQRVRALTPPDELATAHALVLSALDLAATAARVRRDAVRSGSIETARDASSAAAGALMLMARARADIAAQVRPPQIGPPQIR